MPKLVPFVWFVVSLAFNAFFLLVIFFRSALNEILVDKYKSCKKNKEKKKQNLLKLRSLAIDYSTSTLALSMQGIVYMKAQTPGGIKESKPHYDKTQNDHEKAQKGLSNLRIELPKSFQNRIDSLMAESTKCKNYALLVRSGNVGAVSGLENWTDEDFIKCIESLQAICAELSISIEKELRNV